MTVSSILTFVILNGWHLIYFGIVQPYLLIRLERVPETRDLTLGFLLLTLQLAEIVGLWLKYPAVHRRIRERTGASALGFFLVGISILGHMGLTTGLMSFATLNALGIDLRGMTPVVPLLLAMVFFFAMLIKEGVLLVFVLDYQKPVPPIPVPGLSRRFRRGSEFVADGILAVFGAVAYTVTWEQTIAASHFTATTLGGRLLELFGAVLFFSLVFPALHPLSVADVWLVRRSWQDCAVSSVSFLITMLFAIMGIPRKAVRSR